MPSSDKVTKVALVKAKGRQEAMRRNNQARLLTY